MTVWLRLCDEDRDKFGGPEWVEFNQASLDDEPFEALHAWEQEMDMTIYQLRGELIVRSVRSMRAAAWLARQRSGVEELRTPGWAAFDIHTLKVRARRTQPGGDADPPSTSSPTDGDGEAKTAESSATSPAGDPSATPSPS